MILRRLVLYFSLWQVTTIVFSVVSQYILPLQEPYLGGATQAYVERPLVYSRANFDGVHYLSIAEGGYKYAEQAFFPLYPILIKKLFVFIQPAALAGIVISTLSFIFGLLVLVKLMSLDYDLRVINFTLLLLLLFPTSFFFTSVYTEGLFFFFAITAFYFARTRNWWLAGLFAALAANTRFIGIFLLPAFLVEWWQQESSRRLHHLLPILLISLGLISYMSFLNHTVGNPLAFIQVQKHYGQLRSEKIVLLYQVFWRYGKMLLTVDRSQPLYLTVVLEAVTGLVFFVTSLYSLFRSRLSYAVFNISAYLLPTLTGSFVSLPRYVLICFPSFIILGTFLSRSNPLNRKIIAVSLSLTYFIFITLFVRGYWVA